MRQLKKRIEALEAEEARRYEDENCICHRFGGAMFHTNEEYEEAKKIPCPIHGFGRWKIAFVGSIPITQPLAPAERHLCHCPPMLERTILEQGRDLTPEEWTLAQKEYEDWWMEDIRSRDLAVRQER